MEKIEEDLRERVKRLRTDAGLSQVALATRANISVQTVKDIEAGRKGAGIKVLQALAQAFSLSIEELVNEKPPVVEQIHRFKARKALRYFESIPDEIYEKAIKFGPSHEVWREVMVVLEEALVDLEIEANKNKKRG